MSIEKCFICINPDGATWIAWTKKFLSEEEYLACAKKFRIPIEFYENGIKKFHYGEQVHVSSDVAESHEINKLSFNDISFLEGLK